MGEPIVKVYEGREVRFCCDACPGEFEQDLPKNIAALDAAIIKDQLPLYPLEISLVSSEELGDHPDLVVAGRLIRLCCADCEEDVRKDPAKFIAMIDEASKRGMNP